MIAATIVAVGLATSAIIVGSYIGSLDRRPIGASFPSSMRVDLGSLDLRVRLTNESAYQPLLIKEQWLSDDPK